MKIVFFILTTYIPVCILGYGEFSTSNKYLWLITEINKCFLTSFIYKAVSFGKRFLQSLAETEFRAKYLEAISQYTILSLFSLFPVEILSLSFFCIITTFRPLCPVSFFTLSLSIFIEDVEKKSRGLLICLFACVSCWK